MRLGFVNSKGQQKGVDSLIVTDLIELARLKSISDALLISGDEDVRVGVQIAQNFGVRVHLVGIYPSRGSQSPQLQQEADTTTELTASEVQKFLSLSLPVLAEYQQAPANSSKATQHQNAANFMATEVAAFVSELSRSEVEGVQTYWKTNRGVPPEIDRKLLHLCGRGQRLEADEVKFIRSEFQAAVKKILTELTSMSDAKG